MKFSRDALFLQMMVFQKSCNDISQVAINWVLCQALVVGLGGRILGH